MLNFYSYLKSRNSKNNATLFFLFDHFLEARAVKNDPAHVYKTKNLKKKFIEVNFSVGCHDAVYSNP